MVEALRFATSRLHEHARGRAADALHRRAQADAVAKRRHELLDVARRAAADRAPLRPLVHRQHAVVVEEAHEVARRESRACAPGRSTRSPRPSARGSRRRTAANSAARRRYSPSVELVAADSSSARRFAIEAQDVADHAVERRPRRDCAAARTACSAWCRCIRARSPRCARRSSSRSAASSHAELRAERDEVRVGPVVEDDEAGVDRDGVPADLDRRACACGRRRDRRPRTR